MNQSTLICPLCQDRVDRLLYRFHLGNERQVIERIRETNPSWAEHDGACSRCIDYYHTQLVMRHQVLPEIGPHFPVKSPDDFVILPTGLRVDADPRFTGKGVTICFIDSGFYPHPDLVMYKNRIKAMIDITDTLHTAEYFSAPHDASWHGTMTSVVCAGDGYLSNGLYKGIASEAGLVLLKVQDDKEKIETQSIVKALKWIDQHHEEYNIRVVNMSLGTDEDVSYKESEVDQYAEQLIEKGIVIVAAVGNNEHGAIRPPANSPHVIAVGGIDDENKLEEVKKLYHSSYGSTIDDLVKPELTAPAIWIAAPILPATKEQEEAAHLHQLLHDNNEDEQLIQRIRSGKYISPHYMHVDGTSFAAPVVSAIVAQMLEANPGLTPADIRQVIFSTAKRIKNLPAERQGFGLVQARKALLNVLRREKITAPAASPYINRKQNLIEFYIHHDTALSISLAGSFNQWMPDVLLLEPGRNGVWKIGIPLLPAGKCSYKFYIDEEWMEDVNNPFREGDGFGGLNSVFIIQ